MSFFDGINFLSWGNAPHYDAVVHKTFGDYYGIQYNHSGGVYCAIGHEPPQRVTGPAVCITYPGEFFEYGAEPGKSRHHTFVCFNGPRVESYVSERLLVCRPRQPLVIIHQFERFYSMMTELHACLEMNPMRQSRATYLLEGLLLTIQEDQQDANQQANSVRDNFVQLASEIRVNPEHEWDFRQEAEGMNISYIHFRRLFRQYLGYPPGQFLQQSRLSQASRLLCSSDMAISEVAELYGFCDMHHFSKLFKKHFQLPPATYRREFSALQAGQE